MTNEASAAADAAGVRIRPLESLADLEAAIGLFDQIWRPAPTNPPLTLELLRAMTKAGNYAAGAYDVRDGGLIGACAGFFGPPAAREMHSHIAGVAGPGLGRGVGFALKLHQRSWALARGVRSIEWTFDPLVRRNAYFNMVKLGARPAEYLPNFYGGMNDAINGAADSDRLLIAWDLRSPLVTDACAGKTAAASAEAELAGGASVALSASADGWPVPGTASGQVLLIAVPRDIEGLRVADPACAAAWRTALRVSLEPLLAAGARVTGFDRSYNGAGWYVVTTESPSPSPPPLPPLPRLPPQEESP